MLAVLDLFSGIGGFSLGLERTGGFKTAAFCEIDPYCRAVLARHWPDVPCHEDIRTLRGDDVGPIDVICGGFPCQPWSLAGKQGGEDDDRHLWPEMARLIREIRPTWVIGENVAGIVSLGLDLVLDDLEIAGYATWQAIIPAAAVGACHRRDRVWIVAHADIGVKTAGNTQPFGRRIRSQEKTEKNHAADAARVGRRTRGKGRPADRGQGIPDKARRNDAPDAHGKGLEIGESIKGRHAAQSAKSARIGGTGDAADANGAGLQSRRRNPGCEESQRRASWRDLERRIEDTRTAPKPPICRVDDGLSEQLDGRGRISTRPTPKGKAAGRQHQLTGLGNAVHPLIPEALGNAILETLDE